MKRVTNTIHMNLRFLGDRSRRAILQKKTGFPVPFNNEARQRRQAGNDTGYVFRNSK